LPVNKPDSGQISLPSSVDFPGSLRLNGDAEMTIIKGEFPMRYLCLIYYDEKKLNALSRSERETLSGEAYAYCDLLRQKGQFISAEPLEQVHTATTVRIRDGKAVTTDGPFAETKEQLGGFFMIDVADLNEAIQVASKIPPGRLGSVEVRPIKEGGCA
jgi:hypothetical protein